MIIQREISLLKKPTYLDNVGLCIKIKSIILKLLSLLALQQESLGHYVSLDAWLTKSINQVSPTFTNTTTHPSLVNMT